MSECTVSNVAVCSECEYCGGVDVILVAMEVYQTLCSVIKSWNGGERGRVESGLLVGFIIM